MTMRQYDPTELHPAEVEVCADCLRAECLDGIEPCPQSKENGESVIRDVAFLRQLKLEPAEAWARDDLRP